MTANGRRSRRGFSLIEMLVAMTTMTFVMGVCVALLQMLLKLDAAGQTHVETEATIARAARVFRRDARSAAEVSRCPVGSESDRLGLTLPGADHAVEYRVRGDDLLRAEWHTGELVEQERFRLPARSSGRFEHREADGRGTVSLVFDRRGRKGDGEATVRAFRIEAATGADRRFEGTAGRSR